MQKTFAFTKKRGIAFAIAMLLPLLAVVMGVYLLTVNICINRAFIIVHVAIPLIAAVLLAFCIFSGMKRIGKMAVTAVILILFVAAFLFAFTFGQHDKLKCYTGEEAAQQYRAAKDLNCLMPSLSEIGEPVDLEYYQLHASAAVYFVWDTYHLVCKYDAEEYVRQKELLEEKYVFQTDRMRDDHHSCEPTAEIAGYQFRVLSTEGEYGDDIYYPKRLVLIAYSDEAQEIVYLSFYDVDLDYISSLKEFINHDCGWKYTR